MKRIGYFEVIRHLSNADLFALSSLMEGLPVVLMEAMGMGPPVVAPRLAGIPELIDDGTHGLLFSPANFDELADKLIHLLSKPDLRNSLGARGRERVLAEFEIDRAVEPLWRRFRDLG